MKLTFDQVVHTLKWNCLNLWSDIRLIPFTIKLKWLAWKYGGGENIPPEEIGKLSITHSEEEDKALRFALTVNRCVNEVADKFNLPEDNRKLVTLVSQWCMGLVEDVELNDAVGKVIHKKPLRLALYKAMRACEDITDNDLELFQQKNDWKAFIAWLNEPVDR